MSKGSVAILRRRSERAVRELAGVGLDGSGLLDGSVDLSRSDTPEQ